jgi:hypothetical protein
LLATLPASIDYTVNATVHLAAGQDVMDIPFVLKSPRISAILQQSPEVQQEMVKYIKFGR